MTRLGELSWEDRALKPSVERGDAVGFRPPLPREPAEASDTLLSTRCRGDGGAPGPGLAYRGEGRCRV